MFQPVLAVQASASPKPVSPAQPLIGPDAPDWPPIFTKRFSPNPIYVDEISTLTFTITNQVWMDLTGAAFTDPLPPGVRVADIPAASTTCKGAIFSPAPGATSLSFSHGILPGRGTCTAQVDVTSSSPGEYFNITSELTTDTGLIGLPASDTLVVLGRHPSITLSKEVSASSSGPWVKSIVVPAETSVYYRLTVENTGDVDLANVQVSDPGVDLSGCSLSTPFTLTTANPIASCTIGPFTAHVGVFTNTATAQGQYNGKTYTATSSAEVIGTAVAKSADLAVTKTNGAVCVYIDGTTTYTIRVTNNGPDAVTGATLVDSIDPGLNATSLVCSSALGNQCVTTPLLASLLSTGISLPALSPGQFYEIQMLAAVTAVSGTVANTATVTPPTGTTDPDPNNNSSTDNDLVLPPPSADLAVTKTDGVTYVRTNTATTYTIRVTNKGPDAVTGATLVDSVGAGLTATGVVCSPVPGNECGTTAPILADLTSTGIILPALTPGQFYEIQLTANVTPVSGSVTNTATVTMPIGTPDPNPSNNTATDTDTIFPPSTPSADLAVSKTNGVTFLNPNTTTIYTVRVTNNGPDAVTGATFVDTVGTGLSAISVACSTTPGNQCVSAPSLPLLTSTGLSLPTLAPGQFYEIKLTAIVTAVSGSVTNTATVSLPNGFTDPTPGNNTASDTDTIPVVPPQVDLSVTKTDGVTTVGANTSTTYTVRVTYNGPDSVTGATLVDGVGAGLSATFVVCSSASGNQCVTAPLLVDLISTGINLPTLASGQFYEVALTAIVTAPSGSVTNTATVSLPPGFSDSNPGNNTASDTDTIGVPQADLSVTKTDGLTAVGTNTSTTYTVRVTNNGPDSAIGANFVDIPDAGLSATSVACSLASGNQCVSAPSLAVLTSTGISLPTLTPGQFYEILLTATVTAASGSVTNTATVSLPNGFTDPTPGNNTASDTDTLLIYHLWAILYKDEPIPTTTSVNAVIGYEDLPLSSGSNDYDYNDWSVALDGQLTFQSTNLLEKMFMFFTPRSRGGTYDHAFTFRIPAQTFASNGTAVIRLYDVNHNLISTQTLPFTSNTENNYLIFARTSIVFPGSLVNTIEGTPKVAAQRYADLTITFDTPAVFNYSPELLNHPHGQSLFFDPVLFVYNTSEQIHRGDERLLSIPSSSWLWPEEFVRIDRAYPLVQYVPGTPPTLNFPASWWTVHNNCVYDGITCSP